MRKFLFTMLFFLSAFTGLQADEKHSTTAWVIQDQDIKISATDISAYIKQVKQGKQPYGHAGLQHHLEHYYIREYLVKKAEEKQLTHSDKYQQALQEFQKNYLASEALNAITKQQRPDFSARAKEIYLAKKKSDYQLPLRLRVAMIRMTESNKSDSSRLKLNNIRRDIKNKSLTFEDAINRYSDDPMKSISKGDSFWFSKGQKPDAVYQQALNLSEENALSPVFKHMNAWYLLQFKGHQTARVQDFSEVKTKITKTLEQTWRKDFQKEKLDELKQRFTHVKVDMDKIEAKLSSMIQ